MTTFRVAFDGEWQEDFDSLTDAMEWAQEVSATGRTTWVAAAGFVPALRFLRRVDHVRSLHQVRTLYNPR